MPVHKHYGKFRARLAVGGKWKTAPQRNTEGAAEEDMRQLEAVKDQGMVAVERWTRCSKWLACRPWVSILCEARPMNGYW